MINQKGKIVQAIGLLTLVFMAIVIIPSLISQAGLGLASGTPDIVSSKARMMEDALNLYRNDEEGHLKETENTLIKEATIDCDGEQENSYNGYNGFSGAPMLTPFRPGRVALW